MHGSERRLGIHGLTKYSLCYTADERKEILTFMLQHFSEFLILLVSPHVGEQMTPLVPQQDSHMELELAQYQGWATGLDVSCA